MSTQDYRNSAYSKSSDTYIEPVEPHDAYEEVGELPSSPPAVPHQYEHLQRRTQEPSPRPTDSAPTDTGCKRPRWYIWLLIVIGLLILIAVIVVPISIFLLIGKAAVHMPASTTAPSVIPTHGHFITECETPTGYSGHRRIWDVCWVDATTLMAVKGGGQEVVKFVLDQDGCSHTVIDTGYRAGRVACDGSRMAYVADYTNDRVLMYSFTNPGPAVPWQPQGVLKPRYISLNKWNIVVAEHGSISQVSVYNKEREFLHQIQVSNTSIDLSHTYLTDGGVWLASVESDQVLMYDTPSDMAHLVGGYGQGDGLFDSLRGVSSGPNEGSLLICDWGNHRISVFSLQGEFVAQLTLVDKQVSEPYAISVVDRPGDCSLMAVSARNSGVPVLLIYSLS